MAYTYDPIFAADPNNPSTVASNAAITLFNPADTGKAPITITDVTGSPLPNPITVNRNGFGPAFQHATLDRVGWSGGGFTGYFTSYEGMKAEAVSARTAAQEAATNAGSAATIRLDELIAAGNFKGPAGPVTNLSIGAIETTAGNPLSDAVVASEIQYGTATTAALEAKILSQGKDNFAPRVVSRALGKLHAGLAARNTSPARLVFAGSSTTAYGAPDAYHIQMLQRIQAQFPASSGSEVPLVQHTNAEWGTTSNALGVHGYSLGEGGTTAATYITDAEADKIIALQPLAVFHMVGSNDFSGNVPPATYKAQVLDRITKLKTGITKAHVHILIQPFERYDATFTYPWADYGKALRELAEADPDNVAYLDISAPYYAAGVPGADPFDLMTDDKVHMNSAGYYLMAQLILRGLGLDVTAKPASSVAETSHAVVLDYFNRADAATPGAALSGQAWSPAAGAWAIESGRMRPTAPGTAVVDAGTSDFDVSATVFVPTGGAACGVLGRAVGDASRIGLFVASTDNSINLFVKHGATNYAASGNASRADLFKIGANNLLRLRGKGAQVTGWLNGVKVIEHTLSSADQAGLNVAGNTFVGVRSGGSTTYIFDSFAASIPV